MPMELSRRDFLGTCSALACVVSLNMTEAPVSHPCGGYTGKLCLFSKPLPGMDWRQLAQAAKSLGFGGIDLTVRQGRRKKWQILYALQIFAWGTLWKIQRISKEAAETYWDGDLCFFLSHGRDAGLRGEASRCVRIVARP